MEGIEFVTELRKLDNQADTHVVMLTTEENRDILSRAMKAGVNELFPKQKLDSVLEHITSWAQKLRLEQTSGNILYVEDNQSTALVVSELLKNAGYGVKQVSKGVAALELAENPWQYKPRVNSWPAM